MPKPLVDVATCPVCATLRAVCAIPATEFRQRLEVLFDAIATLCQCQETLHDVLGLHPHREAGCVGYGREEANL